MAEVLLKTKPRQVRRGLPKTARAALDARLLKLVANPLPKDAIRIARNPARYRIQFDTLTIGYEYDQGSDEVIIKAILHDEDNGQMDETEINKWLEKVMKRD